MCEYYGGKIRPSEPLGYKDGQYIFGFFFFFPNNTLPIFWAKENWKPLFKRNDKNYGEMKDVFGKYI
jgi:hypothetical protein